MRVSYGIFTVSNKSFELRRCSNYRKSNYRGFTVKYRKQYEQLNGNLKSKVKIPLQSHVFYRHLMCLMCFKDT